MAWLHGVRLLPFLIVALIPPAIGTNTSSIKNRETTAKWVLSEYGKCSAECGGGIEVRTARCIQTSRKSGTKLVRVLESLCPSPAPQITQPCNTHACSAHWTTGKWSECGVTCGTGTQTRHVSCQSTLWTNQGHQVADSECEGLAPESSRRCHVTDCPFSDKVEPHSILSENYTLLQLHRTKKIKVNVGGQVNLLPGQSVVVKCPVKYFSKKLIHWSKGYKLVPLLGRVRGTSSGLHITKGNPITDSGVYTCIAGDLTSTITINFITKNDPSTKMYKQWLKKSNNGHRNLQTRYSNNIREINNILRASTDFVAEDLNQQRDQSQNLSQSSLMYVAGEWSECSADCGTIDHRKRKVTCTHVNTNYVKIVSDAECQRSGLDKPSTVEECSFDTNCAVWRAGPWSHCLPESECAKIGYSNRLLTCVWQSTGEPAGAACDIKTMPIASKSCKPKLCPFECNDSSRYCSLSRMLKLCRYQYFQQECCLTCEALYKSQG